MNDTLSVESHEVGQRLDRVLCGRFPNQSRSFIQKLFTLQRVLVNGRPAKKSLRVARGDSVSVEQMPRREISLEPEAIPLNFLYEDDHLLAVNKPAGLVVHPGVGHWSGTFVNALLYHCEQLPTGVECVRPGIVHRLDKDTSGILLAAKTAKTQAALMQQFAEQRIHKEYRAICIGNPGSAALTGAIARCKRDRKRFHVVETGGRAAVTLCETLRAGPLLSEVALFPKTGRTHQLRVHLQHRGTPILGDAVYGSAYWNKKLRVARQLLHAYAIRLKHPITGQLLELQASVPGDFDAVAHTACQRS